MLTKILKNAPIGLELYSNILGPCKFLGVCEGEKIRIGSNDDDFTVLVNGRDGSVHPNGECVLWPSKGGRWEEWQEYLLEKSVGSLIYSVPKGRSDFSLYLITSESLALGLVAGRWFTSNLSELINESTTYASEELKKKFIAEAMSCGCDITTDSDGTIKILERHDSNDEIKRPEIIDRNYIEGLITIKNLNATQYNLIFSLVKTWQK